MSRRTDQVGTLMQKILGEQMLGLELPAMTTISRVEVTADLKHAKVWITVFSEDDSVEQQALKTLQDNVYDLQGALNSKMKMHHTPRIAFAVDVSLHYASRINELLKKTHEDKE